MRPTARLLPRGAARAAALLALLALPGTANAQGVHPLPSLGRPLHVRLAESDRVAFATVDATDVGRIRMRDAVAVFGEVEPRFEVKRAPSSPPPWQPGDRALVLLRGARPPYALVDQPRETIVMEDAAAERRWREALTRLSAATGEPSRLLRVYLDWVDGPSEGMRSAARLALLDPLSPFRPLPDDVVAERVHVALDPGAPQAARELSAALAARSERGVAGLIARVPGDGDDASAAVTTTALAAGLSRRSASAEAALLRALRHPRVEIRRVGMRFSRRLRWNSQRVSAQLERMAREESDTTLRGEAQRLLAPRADPST